MWRAWGPLCFTLAVGACDGTITDGTITVIPHNTPYAYDPVPLLYTGRLMAADGLTFESPGLAWGLWIKGEDCAPSFQLAFDSYANNAISFGLQFEHAPETGSTAVLPSWPSYLQGGGRTPLELDGVAHLGGIAEVIEWNPQGWTLGFSGAELVSCTLDRLTLDHECTPWQGGTFVVTPIASDDSLPWPPLSVGCATDGVPIGWYEYPDGCRPPGELPTPDRTCQPPSAGGGT